MSRNLTIFLIIAVSAIAAAAYLWPRPCPSLPKAADDLRTEACRLQVDGKDGKLAEAKQKWEAFKAQLPAGECFAAERTEADRNLQTLQERLSSDLVQKVEVLPEPQNYRPAENEIDRAARLYTKGRRVQSIATLSATGRAVFRDFGLRHERTFAYRYRAPLDTEVTENKNGQVVFEQQLGDIVELLAVSDEELQLDPPNSEILNIVAEEFDRVAELGIPHYRTFRNGLQMLETLDPRLKRTLTQSWKLLRGKGIVAPSDDEVDYVVRFKNMSGAKLKVFYFVGYGVTKVEVLDTRRFSKEDLLRFAHNTNVAVDFALQKDIESEKDGEFSVNVEDVASLMSWDGFKAEGRLQLARSRDEKAPEQTLDTLKIVGGRVNVSDASIVGAAGGAVTPKTGSYLLYNRKEHLVAEAQIAWKVESEWQSKDHLLFEAQKIRDIDISSHYAAKLLPNVEKAK